MATEIIFPRVDMDMTSGRIGRWLVAEGAEIKRGEPLFEIETDKAAMEIEAPASGTLRGVKAAQGLEVPVGQVVAWIVGEGEAWTEAPLEAGLGALPPAEPGAELQLAEPQPAEPRLSLRATPLARREARRRGIDLAAIAGSGPNGRVVSADLTRAAVVRTSRIHRRWIGLPTGTPIVLLHGFGSDMSAWRGLWPSLEASHRMLLIDLPGHGQSAVPPSASLEALVDAVQSVLDEEGISRLHLVGHSLGGAIALALADAATLELRSLCLLAPAGLGPEIDGDFMQGFTSARQEASLAPWLRRLFADPGRVTPSFVRAVLQARAPLRDYQQALAASLFPDGTQAHVLRGVLERLSIPTKVVWGREDRIIPVSHGRGLPGRVALHAVPGGHQSHVEAAALVASLVAEAARAGG